MNKTWVEMAQDESLSAPNAQFSKQQPFRKFKIIKSGELGRLSVRPALARVEVDSSRRKLLTLLTAAPIAGRYARRVPINH